MLSYSGYKEVYNRTVKDSNSPYFPYFAKELSLIEKNVSKIKVTHSFYNELRGLDNIFFLKTDDIEKCSVLSAKNLTRLMEKGPNKIPPRLDYLICSNNIEQLNNLNKILTNNYQETLSELPESEYPFIEDGSQREIILMRDNENKFSPNTIHMLIKELSFYSDPPKISSHVSGFRYSLIENCQYENVGDLRFLEGTPPPSACCFKINIAWVVTRRSSFSICSAKKLLFECKFEIKLIKRKILEKCKFEMEYLKKVEETKLAADLQKAKNQTAEDLDRNTPWKSPVDEKKELAKLQEKEKQKQALQEEKELIEKEKAIEEAKRLGSLERKPRSEGDEKKEMAKELESQLDSILKESETTKLKGIDSLESPNIKDLENAQEKKQSENVESKINAEPGFQSNEKGVPNEKGSPNQSSQNPQNSLNPTSSLSTSTGNDAKSKVHEGELKVMENAGKIDEKIGAPAGVESGANDNSREKLPVVTKEDINNSINKKNMAFENNNLPGSQQPKMNVDPHMFDKIIEKPQT